MEQLKGMKIYIVNLVLLALLSWAGSSVALAQVTASMSGRVEDPSGAAVPGANVTVTSLETGAVRTIPADEAGRYQILSLPVGRHEVKAEQAGFKAAVQTGINLVVGQQAVVNLKLEVGAVQEQVTVTSDAPLVNTTTSSVAGMVGETQVKDLPINGRSFDLLITLNPGTVNFTAMKTGAGGNLDAGGNLFSVAGRRPSENRTLLNGVPYIGSGAAFNTPGGASGQLLGVDAVREYNVVSNDYGAEYGTRAGAQVTMVTQSGTNQLHGTLFEFLRNDKLDARNFFDQTSVPPPFKRNQFGGALGGPIWKDKTFIFGNYEGFRQRLALSNVTFVPDLNARQGLLGCGITGHACATGVPAGTLTQVQNIDPRMLPYLTYWPLPNGPNLGGGVAINYNNPLQSRREDFGTARFDHVFSASDNLSAVYTISDGDSLSPLLHPFFGYGIRIRNQVASLQETHIFSPRVVNTFTAGFSRANYLTSSLNLVPLSDSLLFAPGQTAGQISIGQATGIGSILSTPGNQNPFGSFRRNLFTYNDQVQVIMGKHQISAGGWFQKIQQNDYHALRVNGQGSFASFATFLQGQVSSFTVAPRVIPMGWRSWQGSWFVQDSIQLRPNLNLRLGLRHEFSNGWSEVNELAQTVLFQNGVMQTLPRLGKSLLTENNAKWLFSPRVGLAWDPFGKGKTSIRAAFGIYYNIVDWLPYFVDSIAPLNGFVQYNNASLFSIIPINPLATLPPPCGPGVPQPCNIYGTKGIESNYKVPSVASWNFAVEQQLTRDTVLRMTYLGSHSSHMPAGIDPNTIPPQICSNPAGCTSGGLGTARGTVPQGAQYIPVTPSRPNPYLSNGFFQAYKGYAKYHALQAELTQRFSRGLQYRVNYTWAKNLDNISAFQGMEGAAGFFMDPRDPTRDYGRAAFDVRHQVNANMSYQLPFGQGKAWLNGVHGFADKLISGWQFNSIVTLRGGQPFGVAVGSNRSGDGATGGGRPNWNPAFTGNVITGTADQWFDPNAFRLQTAGTWGDVGRNVLQGPGIAMVDFSLFKNTKVSERIALQFRAEVFNSLNRANFVGPEGTVFSGTTLTPAAARITATATSSRQIQFGLKLVF